MSKYKFYEGLWLSLFSKDFYKDVATNWKGKAFLTLGFLLFVCWIPLCVKFHISMSKWIKTEGMEVVNQMPEVTIVNGEISIDKEMPYFVTSKEDGKVLIVFDTTGKYTNLQDLDAQALVTGSMIYMRKSTHEIRSYDMSQVQNFTMTKAQLKNWVEMFRKYFFFVFFIFAWIFSFVYRFFQSVFYGLFGIAFARILKVPLDFTAIVQLSVLSLTLPVIIKTGLWVFDKNIPYFYLISFVISMSYLFFGIKSANE